MTSLQSTFSPSVKYMIWYTTSEMYIFALSISNSIGKYLIFGDVDSHSLIAALIAVIIYLYTNMFQPHQWQNQTDTLSNRNRQIYNPLSYCDHNMYVFWYGLARIFVHKKRPSDYYLLFANCHLFVTEISVLLYHLLN